MSGLHVRTGNTSVGRARAHRLWRLQESRPGQGKSTEVQARSPGMSIRLRIALGVALSGPAWQGTLTASGAVGSGTLLLWRRLAAGARTLYTRGAPGGWAAVPPGRIPALPPAQCVSSPPSAWTTALNAACRLGVQRSRSLAPAAPQTKSNRFQLLLAACALVRCCRMQC